MTIIKDMIETNQTQVAQNATLNNNQGTSRKNLLRLAIICATTDDVERMQEISMQIGTITNKDFVYMDEILSVKPYSGNDVIVEFLCENLNGFRQAHNTYYYALRNL